MDFGLCTTIVIVYVHTLVVLHSWNICDSDLYWFLNKPFRYANIHSVFYQHGTVRTDVASSA